MRKTSSMRVRRIAPGGFLPAALCGGAWLLSVLSGCGGGSAPQAETAPSAPVEEFEEVAPIGAPPSEPAAETAEALSAPADSAGGSVAGKIRDASLAARVHLALAGTRALRAHWFEPEALDGHVILRGHVDTWAQREQAAAVAAGVAGAASVSNELTSTEKRPSSLAEETGLSGNAPDAASGGSGSRLLGQDALPGGGAEGPAYHIVARGESLWTISRRYDAPVDQIKAMNGLTSDELRAGQRLRIR